MPNIAEIHPQAVHFVVALAFVGVGARLASLLPLGEKFRFTNAMATVLIVLAALASVLAVRSGTDAHGPVERVPGARAAVIEHEDAGKLARTFLLGLAVLELATLALARRGKLGTGLRVAAAAGGLATLACVYEAAEHGGELVYNYAGGVGLRSGDSADVRRLLVAGLYHEAMKAREAGRREDAARLIGELERQMPGDVNVTFLAIESQIRDQNQPRPALARLATLPVPPDSTRIAARVGMLTADAYAAAGVRDSARMTLEALKQRYADNQRIQDQLSRALQRLESAPQPPARDSAPSAPARGASRGPR